jgi:hypothetical protein
MVAYKFHGKYGHNDWIISLQAAGLRALGGGLYAAV